MAARGTLGVAICWVRLFVSKFKFLAGKGFVIKREIYAQRKYDSKNSHYINKGLVITEKIPSVSTCCITDILPSSPNSKSMLYIVSVSLSVCYYVCMMWNSPLVRDLCVYWRLADVKNDYIFISILINVNVSMSCFWLLNQLSQLGWLNPLLEGGPMQEGRVSRLLAGLQPY